MTKIQTLSTARTTEMAAQCKVSYVALAIAWYTHIGEEYNAKALVQTLLRSQLDGREIEITETEKQLLERSNPSEAVSHFITG